MNTASSAVNADPSDHLIPFLIFQVIEVKSLETPPFATVGIDSASQASMFPFSSYRASGSSTTEDASSSFVPPDRLGFIVDGACQ